MNQQNQQDIFQIKQTNKFMQSEKINSENLNDSNVINQRLNYFLQNNQIIQSIDQQCEPPVLNMQHYVDRNPTNQQSTIDLPKPTQQSQSELDYYQQFKKIYLISYHLYLQKNKHVENKAILQKRIKNVQDKIKEIEKQDAPKKDSQEENRIKRSRRTADSIQRTYICKVQFCQRCYGSQGSLQQHIKLKHPELYKKDDNIHSQQE